jgi:hypothetical protein
MRTVLTTVLSGVLMIACVAEPEPEPDPVGSTTQPVCQDDRDDCPGGHPITLRQRALIEIKDAAVSIGVSSAENPTVGCNESGTLCWARWRLSPNLELSTGCDTTGCGTSLCVRDTSCGDCWTCNPVSH